MKAAAITAVAFWFAGLFLEQSFWTLTASMICFLISLTAGVISVILSCLAFRQANKRDAYAWALLQGIAPFTIPLVGFLTKIEPNVHGISMPALLLYGLFTELSALLLVVAGARK